MDKIELKKTIIRIGKGSIIAVLLTIILLFLFSVILTYTSLKEIVIPPIIIVITAVSILVGSSISTLKIKKNGLLNGAIIGSIYAISIYLLSSIAGGEFSLGMNSIIMIVSSIIAGMVGGIIGVNL